MDIADQADKSAQTQQGQKMNRVMSAGTDLQPGRAIPVPDRYNDPKWAQMSPITITTAGHLRAQSATGQGQGVVTSSGSIEKFAP